MVTLTEWFEKKDYSLGLAILGRYCKNRILLQNLSRKINPQKLEYELTKLVKEQGIVFGNVEETEVEIKEAVLPPVEDTGTKIQEQKQVNADELPAELKKKWLENQNSYKEIRALHEKLKLMEKATDEDRKPLTERVAMLDDTIRENWEQIDAWVPGQEPTQHPNVVVDFNRINANRKFISTNLKKINEENVKPEKLNLIKNEIQIRYNELKAFGQEFIADTIEELKKAGIKC